MRFGEHFTEHLVSATWQEATGWTGPPRLGPFGPLTISPAMVGLHYGQVVFEGLKAYRWQDGTLAVFRPDAHARRFQRSAERMAMPHLPEEYFLQAVDAFVATDGTALPAGDPALSLYLRPVMFASEACLALRPSREYTFLLMGFVTGGFFSDEPNPIAVLVSREYSRAAPGGTGQAKAAGNYAGAFLAQQAAVDAGCDQVVWVDAAEQRWIEELGGMNIFFVRGSGPGATVVTPALTGTLLPGVTRDSLLTLARERGYPVSEERISVEQWRDECRSGLITETFACGTAAVVTPVGRVVDGGTTWHVGDEKPGPVTLELRQALIDLHLGWTADSHGWSRLIS
ncbi:putative branched-chain amino acid aminotransferase [Actinoplanes missouriensis 431]|uniref:Branched-chain-amino-acid aminotransferase n=1 Tax=Actinoplanes missouriensis (strain ATCC 14538 / DSM 43046 / CBS 188.64 / JCM 3121 / NBRC 102363 / NCIMB 12654 / NRRL B-3342 / UNCC 431) TaxID=512565 RepID=I0HAZ4_ACTM4|nr:branched-chain amino acid aminotransferase [Actinoplanes missouriensis]BAL90181.1 putative branched-chain amino acid aminotransferase [Actinoplanes missouriensis 431]